jgi:hypothetical protein
MMRSIVLRPSLVLFLLTPLSTGCAATILQDESMESRLADTLSMIQAAEQAGAANIPEAAYHLNMARAQVDRAKHMLDYGSEENASPIIARITADASLALAITEREATKIEAKDAISKADAVAGREPRKKHKKVSKRRPRVIERDSDDDEEDAR